MTDPGKVRELVILGSGPAGLTAAVYASRANLTPVCVEGAGAGGQLMLTTDVENYPGFPDAVMGPDLMTRFREQAERFGTIFITDDATRVDIRSRPFRVWIGDNELRSRSLIISTGASPKRLGIPSEATYLSKGVSTCATCDGAFFRGEELIVIGGGDSAIEEALFLTRFATKVTVVHRRKELRASKIMQDRAFANPKIEFLWDSVVEEILGDSSVNGVRVRNVVTGASDVVSTGGVFVAIGHVPASSLFEGQLDIDEQGYIRVSPESTATSVPGVFACGDVVDHVYRQAVTAAGTGCMASIDAERWLEAQGPESFEGE
jgi:thioredoxin reductase (NADPH)